MRHTNIQRPPAPYPATRAPRVKRRIVGLDGLRAIAAFFVLAFHLVPGVALAGFAGVDMFFVLSGFLITSLLLEERAVHGRLDLRRFWVRRCRRLFPAVSVTVVGSAALALMVGGDALVALSRQALGALTATYNWVEIAAGASYFEQSSPLLLTNMWSLAVEQQFYLVWPLVIAAMMTWRRSRRCAVALGLGAVSVVWHAVVVNHDVSRAYMGTDSHLWGLMLSLIHI